MAMEEWEWLNELGTQLGEGAVQREEIGSMLRLARGVAHTFDRRLAPMTTFVAGIHVGRRVAEGATREAAVEEVIDAVRRRSPEVFDVPEGGGGGGGGPRRRRRRFFGGR